MSDTDQDLSLLRHSLSHLLAAAVLDIYPDTKPTLGPPTETGFYYDFDFGEISVGDDDLVKIEAKMREILPTWKGFLKKEVSEKEAREYFKDNRYKLELIEEITQADSPLTFYSSGEFTDLCKGGHLEDMGVVDPQAFKLTSIAGAYWRGDENNVMLTRIYGTAFYTKTELDQYLEQLEEAKRRDHRKLGKELNLFTFSNLVGPGLPLYTPKGLAVLNEIKNYSRQLRREMGYQEVQTPQINRKELFEISGHYEKYKEDMFSVHSNYSKEEYFLKPMNCPQHTQLYAAELRSYRDLPYRLSDHSLLYRDEKPGELSGLTRLRSFSQDDAHCFCAEEQLEEEFSKLLKAIQKAMDRYGLDYYIRFSTRDEDKKGEYLGDDETWENAQTQMQKLLDNLKIDYVHGPGEAAFYGPKMDLMAKDVLNRQWQISTLQLDMNMPGRFGLEYIDRDGSRKTPLMIHSALVGSPERFFGVLIEHYAGAFPYWLAPVQIKVLPIGEDHQDYAQEVYTQLKENGIRSELDSSEEGLGKKIRKAKMEKVPYFLVIGDNEVKNQTVTLEGRDGKVGEKTREELMEYLNNI